MQKFLLLVINNSDNYHTRHEYCVPFSLNITKLHMLELTFFSVDLELVSKDLLYYVKSEML